MDSNKKEINVKTFDSSTVPEMISGLSESNVMSQKEAIQYRKNLIEKAWEIFLKFKREYKRAKRPKSFLGFLTSNEVMMESNNYGIDQLIKFLRALNEENDSVIESLISIARDSPQEFLTAIRTVLTGEDPHSMKNRNRSGISGTTFDTFSFRQGGNLENGKDREKVHSKRTIFKKDS
jgi:hypothetical protein